MVHSTEGPDDSAAARARVCSWWFDEKRATPFSAFLAECLAAGTFAYLACIPYMKDGESALMLRVAYRTEDGQTAWRDFNESFPCPPVYPPGSTTCPGGG